MKTAEEWRSIQETSTPYYDAPMSFIEDIQADAQPQWQPIETAPNDGEIIVSGKSVLDFNEKYVCTAWRDAYGTFHTEQGALKNQPSIWMPLPPPPKD